MTLQLSTSDFILTYTFIIISIFSKFYDFLRLFTQCRMHNCSTLCRHFNGGSNFQVSARDGRIDREIAKQQIALQGRCYRVRF